MTGNTGSQHEQEQSPCQLSAKMTAAASMIATTKQLVALTSSATGTLLTFGVHRQHVSSSQASSQCWYNQRLTFSIPVSSSPQPFTFPVQPNSIPNRPTEMHVISSEMWVEFFEKVHEAARTTPTDNSAATTVSSESSSTSGISFWSSSRLLRTAVMLIYAVIVAIIVLRLLHILEGWFTWSVLWLFLLSVYLRVRKSQVDFDDLHRAGIQAVCSHYSPAFEQQSNFYVEYKHFTSGVVFRQTIIEEFRKQQQFKDAMKAQAHRKEDDKEKDDDDSTVASDLLELCPILESYYGTITLLPA
jgi:hypothetical protein